MCDFLSVSRSAYYDWLVRTPTALEQKDAELIEVIKALFKQGRENYGTRCLKKALKQKGWHVSRRRIARLMRQAGLACKTKRKFKATTDSKHNLPIAPNLLDRQFHAVQPNQKYVGDTSAPCGYYVYPYTRGMVIFGRGD
jgi:transposase InsO family protein